MSTLNERQQSVVNRVRRVAPELAEQAHTWGDEIPWENLQLLADNNILGVNIAEEYGGGGGSEREAVTAVEAVSEVCPDTAELMMNSSLVAPRAIEMFGTESAKRRYLPAVMSGEDFVCIAMSEPDAGSDLHNMSTTVRETGDSLVMNGEKIWVGRVGASSAAVVWAKFPEGLGTAILDLDNPGVEVQHEYTNMVGKTQTHFEINNVEIPAENVLTRGPDAFKQQLKSLNWERVGAAAFLNGLAWDALDIAFDFANQREQFDQPVGEFQGIEWKFADAATQLECSRALTQRAAESATGDPGYPDPLCANMAKLNAGRVADAVVDEALQVHGARGYQRGHAIEYLYRFVRGYRIAGGTDEIHQNTIASLLHEQGLPTLL